MQHRLLPQQGFPEKLFQAKTRRPKNLHVRSKGLAAEVALALAAALPSPKGPALVDDNMFLLLLLPAQV
jgi:hypothetical protein